MWTDAGIIDELVSQEVAGDDRLVGYDMSTIPLGGSTQQSPWVRKDSNRNLTDRGKRVYKWSLATDANGIPMAAVTLPANTPDFRLTGATLSAMAGTGLPITGAVLRSDKGYDYPDVDALLSHYGLRDRVRQRRKPDDRLPERRELLGRRWAVERANAWLTNFGHFRRATDRLKCSQDAWLALAIALTLVVKVATAKHLRPGL